MRDAAYLILENGKVFTGRYFGTRAEVTGEIVFTTGMTGYLETLTDHSYFGQIIVQTFPLIGNYGVIPSDFESSSVAAKAYIVKYYCEEPSNFRSEGGLDGFLKSQSITGLYDIDTRELTKIIRENGVMNGKITAKRPMDTDIDDIKAYKISHAVEKVSIQTPEHYGDENAVFKIALLDFGLKENIKRELIKRNCQVWIFPYNSRIGDILKVAPDGIMLSNGPGDPVDNEAIIKNLKEIIEAGFPIFGICLGHQLLALAHGFGTEKLKYGHRGANQPVKDLSTDRVYITSQNHGYTVVNSSVDRTLAKVNLVNANDRTCEGLEYLNHPIFSAQFHPEACGGPLDTTFLFDRFIKNVEDYKNASRQKH